MPIKPTLLTEQPSENAEQPPQPEEPRKRKRRTKAELIADAVVPAADEKVKLKDSSTGHEIERPWLVAVEMFREGKAEFADASLKYAVMKMDQQKGAEPTRDSAAARIDGLKLRWNNLQKRLDMISGGDNREEVEAINEESDKVRLDIIALGGTDPASDDAYEQRAHDDSGQMLAPEGAEVGDEVHMGASIYRVGHGGVLVQGQVGTPEGDVIAPKRVWQRELGTGGDGAWESRAVTGGASGSPTFTISGGNGLNVESAREPMQEVVQVSPLVYKVSGGYLEKIGLPEYSSLQIGPTSVQRHVADDGRRTKVQMGGRDVELPTAVVEGLQECFHLSEFVMRSERQAMIDFLESVKPGSTRPA